LANKFVAAQPARPESMPKRCFCIGGSSPQVSRTLGLVLVGTSQETPPHPAGFARRSLPARGERLAFHVAV
jgi:hypothetical protein